jgi:hypothetical protein
MRIGVATAFSAMMDFYSLTSVVKSQLRMIKAGGHEPVLIGIENFQWNHPMDYVEIRAVLPDFHKIDYAKSEDITPEHLEYSVRCADAMRTHFKDLDAILTHDLIFTGWNLPINLAVHHAAKDVGPWLHWIHSVPGGSKDFWRVPENSLLVYPNATDRVRCAENFRTWQEKIVVIPHATDLRDIFFTTQFAEKLVTDYDVLGADLVQVYPIPTDRGDAKGIPQVIQIFGQLKALGASVKLIVPNAWCNVDKWRDRVNGYYRLAYENGLTDQEVIFTSKSYPDHEVGLPMEVIKDLALCGNIFICPTKSETFGFSIAEAALAGCLLVLNDDLPPMSEICGGRGNAIWAKMSSNFFTTKHSDEKKYYRDICRIIMHAIESNHSMKSKTHYRQSYRREAIWSKIEGAIMSIKGPRLVTAPDGVQFSQTA